MSKKQKQQEKAVNMRTPALNSCDSNESNRCSSGIKQTVKYVVTVAVRQKAHGVLRRRECIPPGKKDYRGLFVAPTTPHSCCAHLKSASLGLEAKAQGRHRHGHGGGEQAGNVPLG